MNMPAKRQRHPLIETLVTLKGNTRACVWTEPLWGVPYNLYAPYVSLYMAALGLNDAQIGLLASVSMVLQFVWSMLSGALTDKYGRRWTTAIVDILSWSVPCIIWATAQGYWHFMAAIAFNGMWRITSNSWSCLLVDDCDKSKLINIFSLISIAGFFSGFVSPIAGLFIDRFTLVPTMRVLYWIAFALMSSKFIILLIFSKETSVGLQRMKECKGVPLFRIAFGGVGVFLQMLRSPITLFSLLLMLLTTCFSTVQNTFWGLFVTQKYGLTELMISLFPFIRAMLSMVIYFFISAKLSHIRPKKPLLAGFGMQLGAILLALACLPLGQKAMGVAFVAYALEACGTALIMPLTESLMTYSVDMRERARTYSLFYGMMLIASAPAGWIAGQLSQIDRALPFVLSAAFLILSMLISVKISGYIRLKETGSAHEKPIAG